MLVTLAILVGFAMVPAAVRAQENAAGLDTIGREEVGKQKIPGLVLMVVKGGSIAYAKGFGVANVETKEPVTPDHLFRVGSTTKMVVSATAVALAEQGKLKLNAPIGERLSELAGSPLGKLTAHQLLSHTAGLMDRTLMFGRHDDAALAENVRSLQPDVLFTKPGEVYSYSNLGYAMAGRLIEVAADKPFADAVRDLIFEPLGMRRSTFRPTLAMTYPLAQGHVEERGKTVIGRPAADHSGYWPAGSMFTSGNDFARFAMALVQQGKSLEGRSLPAAVIAGITAGHVATTGGGRYGYGIGVDSIDGRALLSHSGGRQGYSSYLIAAPGEQVAVIALINKSGADAAGPARRAFRAVAGWNPQRPANDQPTTLTAEQIRGVYTQYTRTVVIQSRNGKLVASERGKDIELSPDKGKCYKPEGQGQYCFATGPEGRARYLLLGSRALARQDE